MNSYTGFSSKAVETIVDIMETIRDELYPNIDKWEWYLEIHLDTEGDFQASLIHSIKDWKDIKIYLDFYVSRELIEFTEKQGYEVYKGKNYKLLNIIFQENLI